MSRRAFLVAAILIAAAGARQFVLHARPMWVPNSTLAVFPRDIDGWRGQADLPFDKDIEELLGADQYMNRAYIAPDGFGVGLYVGYYAMQRQGAAIHSPLNCLPGAGWQPVATRRVPLEDGSPTIVNRVVVQKGDSRQVVFYWFQSSGRIIASEYSSKIHLVLDSITTGRNDTALVRVMVAVPPNGTEDAVAERARHFAAQAASTVRATLFP